ncbi:transcriptional regulator [Paraburkholderia sp. CI3]
MFKPINGSASPAQFPGTTEVPSTTESSSGAPSTSGELGQVPPELPSPLCGSTPWNAGRSRPDSAAVDPLNTLAFAPTISTRKSVDNASGAHASHASVSTPVAPGREGGLPRRTPHTSPTPVDEIIQLHRNGIPNTEIAGTVSTAPANVRSVIRRSRIPAPKDGMLNPQGRLTTWGRDEIISLHKQGYERQPICQKLGVSPAMVSRVIKPVLLEERTEIRKLHRQGETRKDIARKLGFTVKKVNREIGPPDDRERKEILALHGQREPMKSIAGRVGVTEERVRQVIKGFHGYRRRIR